MTWRRRRRRCEWLKESWLSVRGSGKAKEMCYKQSRDYCAQKRAFSMVSVVHSEIQAPARRARGARTALACVIFLGCSSGARQSGGMTQPRHRRPSNPSPTKAVSSPPHPPQVRLYGLSDGRCDGSSSRRLGGVWFGTEVEGFIRARKCIAHRATIQARLCSGVFAVACLMSRYVSNILADSCLLSSSFMSSIICAHLLKVDTELVGGRRHIQQKLNAA